MLPMEFASKYRYEGSELQRKNGTFQPPKSSLKPFQVMQLLKKNKTGFNEEIISNFGNLHQFKKNQNDVYRPLIKAGLAAYIKQVFYDKNNTDEQIEMTLLELKRFAETRHFALSYFISNGFPDCLIHLFSECSTRSQKNKELAMSVYFLIKRVSDKYNEVRYYNLFPLLSAILSVAKNCEDLKTNQPILYAIGFFFVTSVNSATHLSSKSDFMESILKLLSLCYSYLFRESCSWLLRQRYSIADMLFSNKTSAALIKLYGLVHRSNIVFRSKCQLLDAFMSALPTEVVYNFENRRSLCLDHDLISFGPKGRNLFDAFRVGSVSIPTLINAVQINQNSDLFVEDSWSMMFDQKELVKQQRIKIRKCLLFPISFPTQLTRADEDASYESEYDWYDNYDSESYSDPYMDPYDSDAIIDYFGPQSESSDEENELGHSLYKNHCMHVRRYFCVDIDEWQSLLSYLTKIPKRFVFNADMDEFEEENTVWSNLTIVLLLIYLKVEKLDREEERSKLSQKLLDTVLEFDPWQFVGARNYSQEIRIMFAMLQEKEGKSQAGDIYDRFSLLTERFREFANFSTTKENYPVEHACCFKYAAPYFYQIPE